MSYAIRDEATREVDDAMCPTRTTSWCRHSRWCRLRDSPAPTRRRLREAPTLTMSASAHCLVGEGLNRSPTMTMYRCDELARIERQKLPSPSCWHSGGGRAPRCEGATGLTSQIAVANVASTPRQALFPPSPSPPCHSEDRYCT